MGALSPVHLIIILVIALLIVGPGKLPETGAALGHAIREFRHAVDGKDEPAAPTSDGAGPATPVAPQAAGPTPTDGTAPVESP